MFMSRLAHGEIADAHGHAEVHAWEELAIGGCVNQLQAQAIIGGVGVQRGTVPGHGEQAVPGDLTHQAGFIGNKGRAQRGQDVEVDVGRAADGVEGVIVVVRVDARQDGLGVGHQRHVPAHRGLAGKAVLVHGRGETGPQDPDIFRVDPGVFANLPGAEVRPGSIRLQIQCRGFFVVLQRVQAVIRRPGVVLELQAALAGIPGLLVLAMEKRRRAVGIAAQEIREWPARDQPFIAVADGVAGGEITAGARQASGFPFQLVEGAQ